MKKRYLATLALVAMLAAPLASFAATGSTTTSSGATSSGSTVAVGTGATVEIKTPATTTMPEGDVTQAVSVNTPGKYDVWFKGANGVTIFNGMFNFDSTKVKIQNITVDKAVYPFSAYQIGNDKKTGDDLQLFCPSADQPQNYFCVQTARTGKETTQLSGSGVIFSFEAVPLIAGQQMITPAFQDAKKQQTFHLFAGATELISSDSQTLGAYIEGSVPFSISGISPSQVDVNGSFTISGQGFEQGDKVFLGANEVVATVSDATKITVTLSGATAGSYDITVRKQNERTQTLTSAIQVGAAMTDGAFMSGSGTILSGSGETASGMVAADATGTGLVANAQFCSIGKDGKETCKPVSCAPDAKGEQVCKPLDGGPFDLLYAFAGAFMLYMGWTYYSNRKTA